MEKLQSSNGKTEKFLLRLMHELNTQRLAWYIFTNEMLELSGGLKPIKKVSRLISSEIIPYSQIETMGSEVFSLPLYTAGVPFPAVPISISTMAF